jgi:sulfur dioxygenase
MVAPTNCPTDVLPRDSHVVYHLVEWEAHYSNCRLVEVNGKIVLTKNRDDLSRLLAAAPDPAQLVILRKLSENGSNISSGVTNKEVASLRCELEAVRERAEEAQKTKDGLISDNIRLTHRISYLEEQVQYQQSQYQQ